MFNMPKPEAFLMTKLQTPRFGPLEFQEVDVIFFPKGIPGFEDHRKWILVGDDENPIKWLQSLDDEDVALPVLPPSLVSSDYDPQLLEADVRELKATAKDLHLFVVVSVPEDAPWDATVNLRAPIIINSNERLGKQVISQREDYEIKHHLFDEITRDKMKSAFLEAGSQAPTGGGAS
jgi:flagellar assembly factor FliW